MIPIFIPSYNRAGNTRTVDLLERCGVTNYKVVVRPSQYDAYAQHLKRENLLMLDAEEGLSYAREFIRKRVKRGGWALHMDDNVMGFYVCNEEFYKLYDHFEKGPGGLTEINRRWDHIIKNPPGKDFTTFYRVIVKDTMREADKRGAVLCGFTAQNAAAMRPYKWHDVGYVCGKVMLMKNVGFPWRHISVSTGEDYALTAAHLLEFGRVLVNGWGHPRRKHYAPGGCGTYEERLPEMIRTSAELMERYPGLFRMKTPGPKGIERYEGELRLRLSSLEQIEKWRANFGKVVTIKTRPAEKSRKASSSSQRSSPVGHHYVLVNEAKAYAPGSPQAVFVLAALKRAGGRGLTRAEVIAKAVADQKRFPTNQPHDRAVGFWLSKLKGQGALAFSGDDKR